MPVITVISNSSIAALRNILPMVGTSVVDDRIEEGDGLVVLLAAVVGIHVIGMLVAQLRLDLQILRDPVREADGVAAVARGVAGALALLVVVELVADRQHVVGVQFEVQAVHDTKGTRRAGKRRGAGDAGGAARTKARNVAA